MVLQFDRFRFDAANRRLEDSTGPVHLNPKAFEVLNVLIQRRGELVSKDQLLDEVWPKTHVDDGVLKVCMSEIRSALGDSATRPRFIETVHKHGYRFVADVAEAPPIGAEQRTAPTRSLLAWPPGGVPTDHSPVGLVGRAREIEFLEERLARALRGERQVVFVTGEPGVGKTALVENFVSGAAGREILAVTGGQCLEHLGSAEAYLPVLEAVGRLVREAGFGRSLLRRYAPMWFAELPWLVEDADRDELGRQLFGVARERMLREIGEFVEALSAEIPLVVALEDLHWSDPSTVDLLSLLAARREPARLLLLATYRPVDLVLARHPLRAVAQKLAASRRSSEVALDVLGVEAVAEYVARRFPGSRFSPETAKLLRERTDGNPLFLVTVIDHLLARSAIVERSGRWQIARDLREELTAVPEGLRLLIEQELERLAAEDRELLEGASLVGIEFSAAAAAVAANRPAAEAEARCERLSDARRFLRRAETVEWPDGTVAAHFAFRHPLHRETLAEAVPIGRRADLHSRIGRALEAAYGERSPELGAELAIHFEQGGDRARAARYRRLAGESAARRCAFVEAESHFEKALELLGGLPASSARDRDELLLQSALGAVRMATHGYAAPEVETAYGRALELANAAPREPSFFRVLWGLLAFYAVRGDLDRALELAERLRLIAEADGDPLMRLVAHHGLWTVHFFRGDLAAALRHLDEGEPLYELVEDRVSGLAYGQDQKVAALAHRAILLWHVGHVDEALEMSRHAVEHARALGHPMSLAFAMSFAAWLRLLRREPEACREQAEAVIAYATEQGMPHWIPATLHTRGWAMAEQGDLEAGIADMEQALTSLAAMGERLGRSPRLNDLVIAKTRAGRLAEARALIEESKAVAATTGEHFQDAETHQCEAELIIAEAGGLAAASREARNRAEHALQQAIESARRCGARTPELRATTALARVCERGVKGNRARARLAELLASFSEGFDTADLRDARRLLEETASAVGRAAAGR